MSSPSSSSAAPSPSPSRSTCQSVFSPVDCTQHKATTQFYVYSLAAVGALLFVVIAGVCFRVCLRRRQPRRIRAGWPSPAAERKPVPIPRIFDIYVDRMGEEVDAGSRVVELDGMKLVALSWYPPKETLLPAGDALTNTPTHDLYSLHSQRERDDQDHRKPGLQECVPLRLSVLVAMPLSIRSGISDDDEIQGLELGTYDMTIRISSPQAEV
ncbi:hypothetical protein HMN09_00062900 [Mycena chlorophos]|uniref:Uncharacterized protein n=1 Tax=Mycena chlorophos TaxID=658473 RepID=A0A8H6TPH6_MYCCL|nr:hypothetical protein HMN09_00062900 [Mycena chlorophos]